MPYNPDIKPHNEVPERAELIQLLFSLTPEETAKVIRRAREEGLL